MRLLDEASRRPLGFEPLSKFVRWDNHALRTIFVVFAGALEALDGEPFFFTNEFFAEFGQRAGIAKEIRWAAIAG